MKLLFGVLPTCRPTDCQQYAMSVDFIPTIEDDEDVEREESDSEEEASRAGKHKKSTMFVEGFKFSVDGGADFAWEEDSTTNATEVSQFTSLNAKIARAREMRKLKAEQAKLAERSRKERKRRQKEGREGDESPSEEGSESSGGEEEMSEEGVSDLEEEMEHPQSARTREERDPFFEEPPPQQNDISFTDMNLSRPLLKAVTALGFATPTPIQACSIPVALMGKDICACAATGTGKTAAFMLPILERLLFRPTRTPLSRVLVLVPTRELAIQVHSVGKSLSKHTNVEVCLATGGLESRSQEAALRKNPDIIVATPGRLVDHLHNAPSFSLQNIEILVLDEADRMLDEHFEDQMNEIIRLCPKSRQTMLFSATMTDQVEELVRLSLNHPMRLFVDSNTDVADNLHQEFVRVKAKREGDREAIVTALCCRTFREHCLVFLPMKRIAHRMRIVFGLLGLRASELHGSLTQLQRLEALKLFKEGEVDFLLATDLAARGLDIERVRTVVNYNMSATVKQYIHRVGRTARAGRSGRSVTLVGEKERKVLKEVVKQAKTPVKSRIVPQEVVVRYRDQIRKLEPEIKTILKQEEEEKQLRLSEMEIHKAQNMIEHQKEIFSRPAKTWLQPTASKKRAADGSSGKLPESKKGRKRKTAETPEEKTAQFAARAAKRAKKQKRLYAIPPGEERLKKTGKINPRPVIKAFDKELTDTSKKALSEFRRMPSETGKAKGSRFKSKKRYK